MRSATLSRPARALAAAIVFALLATAGCGGPIKRVNPPAATVQRLTVANEGKLALDLRLQNHSDLATRFDRIEATVALEGAIVGTLSMPLPVEVAPHSVEIVAATLALAPADAERLKPAIERGQPLRYGLDGTVTTEEPDGKYPLEYESRLSPVPGRPGEYR